MENSTQKVRYELPPPTTFKRPGPPAPVPPSKAAWLASGALLTLSIAIAVGLLTERGTSTAEPHKSSVTVEPVTEEEHPTLTAGGKYYVVDQSIADTLDEFYHYTSDRVVFKTPDLAKLRISGDYIVGPNVVADLMDQLEHDPAKQPLRITHEGNVYILEHPPKPNGR